MLTTDFSFATENAIVALFMPSIDLPSWRTGQMRTETENRVAQFSNGSSMRNWYRTNDAVAHCMANDLF